MAQGLLFCFESSNFSKGLQQMVSYMRNRVRALFKQIDWQLIWREFGLPMLLFTAVSVAVSWPMVRDFRTQLMGNGGDTRNNMWMLWHVKEFVSGNTALFHSDLLFYPHGISLLTRGFGPLLGFLVLPLWPLGPIAVHNSSVLLGLVLTGYGMYLFARGMGFERRIALFAGILLLMAPIHLVGLRGHQTKVFLGLIPVVILCTVYTVDTGKKWCWALITAVILLLTALHNGQQLVFCALFLILFLPIHLLMTDRSKWLFIIWRSGLLAVMIGLIVGPLLLAIDQASENPAIIVGTYLESQARRPDLAEFLLPPSDHWLFEDFKSTLVSRFHLPNTIETAVSIPLIALALGALALKEKRARPWLLLTLAFTVLALGPSLRLFGRELFTKYQFPVILPYAILTEIPLLNFLRTPGRFMMIGMATLAITAVFGLQWLINKTPRWGNILPIVLTIVVFIETWPSSWNQQQLPPIPEFYSQIGEDEAEYGVIDLPIIPNEGTWYIGYSSMYQWHQTTHGKGLPRGYVARSYYVNPLLPCLIPKLEQPSADFTVNGRSPNCTENMLQTLAANNYRYVVLHKTANWPNDPDRKDWGREQADLFLNLIYGETRAPIVDDELVQVFEIPQLSDETAVPPATIGLKGGWFKGDNGGFWVRSPAKIYISAAASGTATVQFTPTAVHDPTKTGTGILQVKMPNGEQMAVPIRDGEPVDINISYEAGFHVILLHLESGFTFQEAATGAAANLASFFVDSINVDIE